jgi:hypothetical protein
MHIGCDLVEDALEHLWDYSYLGSHALALTTIPDAEPPRSARLHHRDQGKFFSEFLQRTIEQLKTDGPQRSLSRERRFYEILYRIYVDGEKNDKVASSLSISPRTLYRERRKALETVTRILNEMTED